MALSIVLYNEMLRSLNETRVSDLSIESSIFTGVRSFRYKVVSIQVVSIQIEVVSIHMKSRFDTH